MTSDPQNSETQGSQSGGTSRWELFKNLLFLARATEVEIAKQAQQRVQMSIEAVHMENILKEKLKNQIDEIVNNVSEEKDKQVNEVKIVGNKARDEIKIFRDQIEKDLVNLKVKLGGRINGAIFCMISLGAIFGAIIFVTSPSLVQYLQSILNLSGTTARCSIIISPQFSYLPCSLLCPPTLLLQHSQDSKANHQVIYTHSTSYRPTPHNTLWPANSNLS